MNDNITQLISKIRNSGDPTKIAMLNSLLGDMHKMRDEGKMSINGEALLKEIQKANWEATTPPQQ